MHNLLRTLSHVTLGTLPLLFGACGATAVAAEIFRAQGEMTGEVSANSAIVQTRLTSVDRNVAGEVPGAVGVARFEVATNARFEPSRLMPWNSSRAETDYIIKAVLRDLKPGTRYYYRVHYGADRETTQPGPTCSFRTLGGATGTDPVSFVVVTGMMYGSFHGKDRPQKGPRPDRAAGYPALQTMLGMDLDFFVGTGDNVYYDTRPGLAKSQAELRQKWHEQFVQSRYVELFRNVPTYWAKDNHTNHQGFRREGREFFQWVVRHNLHQQGFYTVCGDRHWQYHSKDPLGVEEFSCGALVDENSRLGRKPGDPKSTDPDAEVHQFYTQSKASGGFLRITAGPGQQAATGSARFTFVDDLGKVLYETEKVQPVKN